MNRIIEVFKTNKLFKSLIILLFLLVSVWWAGKGIFKYNVYSTHDGNHHLSRSYDVVQTIKEGHFPLRWAGSLNYNCGVPIYNFFYPLIYYSVALIDYIHPDVILALKIINFLSLLLGTLFFYFWMKVETGKELPAIGGALLYLYAPYRFSLIFVRGSPEFLAYAILPVVLFFFILLIKSKNNNIYYAFWASITGALLAISHNFTVMFLFPIIFAYLIVKLFEIKADKNKVILTVFSYLSSIGLASFFIGPALLEKKYTKIGENFLMWQEHFPTLGQLIRSRWDYFYSSLGTINDGMSFMLGYAHWLVLFLGFVYIMYGIKNKKYDLWVILTFLSSVFVIYLILPISIPLWKILPPLQEIQFSWRLLGVAVFTISALFSYLLSSINNKKIVLLLFLMVVALGFVGNRNHLLPQPVSVEEVYKYDDYENLHQHRHSTTTLGDDIIAKGADVACWFDDPFLSVDKKEIEYVNVERGNTFGFVKFVLPEKIDNPVLKLSIGYFPGAFDFRINGQKVDSYMCDGKNCFNIDKLTTKENVISWKVVQTPIQKLFNTLTVAFFVIWLLIIILGKTKNDKSGVLLKVLLFVIFVLFLFFRAYNIDGRIGFGWDQERDAVAIKEILSGDIKLIGPRVYGPTGFFLPPYFFYLLLPFYLIFNLNPIATVWFVAMFAIAFFFVANKVISKMFNSAVALIFLSFWAVNPMAISIDTISWNPILIPLFFVVTLYFAYISILKNTFRNLLFLGLAFGFGISFHLQFVFVFPLILMVLYDLYKNKNLKFILPFIVGLAVPFLPILIFDLKHDFLNIKQIFLFEGFGGNSVNRLIPVWSNFNAFAFGFKNMELISIFILLLSLLGYLVLATKEKRKEIKHVYMGLFLTLALSLPIFRLIIKNPSEYYFNYLLLPILLLLSIALSRLKKTGILLIVVLILYFTKNSMPLLNDASLGLKQKNDSVVFLKKITNDSDVYNVSFDVPFNEDSGFRYLLNYNNVPVSGSDNDPLVEFVLPLGKRETDFNVGNVGLKFPMGLVNFKPLVKM